MLSLLISGVACLQYQKTILISRISVNEIITSENDIVTIPFTLKNCSNSKIYILDVAHKISYIPGIVKDIHEVQFGFPTIYLMDNKLFHEYVPINRFPKLLAINPNETIKNEVSIKTGTTIRYVLSSFIIIDRFQLHPQLAWMT